MVAIPYTLYERTKLLAEALNGLIEDEEFGVDVTLTLRFHSDRSEKFRAGVIELSHGQVTAEYITQQEETLFPRPT
jgi:putative IMPACT (imprinted ancient) family translation regulator